MGYYVNLEDAQFLLPTENEAEALSRLKALNAPVNNHLKRGGSWGAGTGQNEWWYSWMEADYDKKVTSVAQVFEMMGFDVHADENGTSLQGYDSKIGQEDLFLGAIADLVQVGSYLSFVGEDGDRYRYEFDGKTMHTKQATIVWD